MAKLFDYNNIVWRFMGRVADMFFLTLLWAIGSLPLITIGASTTALYYVALKMVKNQEGYIWKSFWKSYGDNLKTATGIWCIMAVMGTALGFGLAASFPEQGAGDGALFWGLLILSLLYLFWFTLVFPLTARLDTGIKGLLYLSFMTSLKNFSWVMFMVIIAICIVAMGVFVFWPLLLFGAGIIAFAHGLVLVHVIFPKYNWNN
ncbi:MAG: YesL family protein [Lachnospiraceae bacterium]|nr:YesL family protein [Lachnospiraceae bacterium]